MNVDPKGVTAKEMGDFLLKFQEHSKRNELRVFVKIYNPGTAGGTPCEPVTSVLAGFDWDHGKLILDTERKLTALDQEQVSAILDSVRKGSSWHAFEREKKHQSEKLTLKHQNALLLASLKELRDFIGTSRTANEILLARDGADALIRTIEGIPAS